LTRVLIQVGLLEFRETHEYAGGSAGSNYPNAARHQRKRGW
jgi:hypothetical protein